MTDLIGIFLVPAGTFRIKVAAGRIRCDSN